MDASEGRVALVVGVGPGLGEAVARRLVADGYRVAIARRNVDALAELAAELGARAYGIDVGDAQSLHEGLAAVERDLGPIHTVCWNVGGGAFGTLDKVDITGLDRALDTNTRGLFLLAKQLLPQMAERGDGALIVTGATASTRGKPFTVAFAPGKMAQRGLVQALARTYWPQGVHVALLLVDGQVHIQRPGQAPGRPLEEMVSPAGYAQAVSFLLAQPRTAWSLELDIRPNVEPW